MVVALSAHFELMQRARERGEIRTIPGRAYPVSKEELEAWVARKNAADAERRRAAMRNRRITPDQVFA